MADELIPDEELPEGMPDSGAIPEDIPEDVAPQVDPLVEEIKVRLGLTGNHHDSLLLAYANDTKDYLVSAGVHPEVVDSRKSIGVIARGVADLWNFGAGEGKFSQVFYQRAIQLTAEVVEDVPTETTV